jgi:hypothetical protein
VATKPTRTTWSYVGRPNRADLADKPKIPPTARHPAKHSLFLVELRGFEPLTP